MACCQYTWVVVAVAVLLLLRLLQLLQQLLAVLWCLLMQTCCWAQQVVCGAGCREARQRQDYYYIYVSTWRKPGAAALPGLPWGSGLEPAASGCHLRYPVYPTYCPRPPERERRKRERERERKGREKEKRKGGKDCVLYSRYLKKFSGAAPPNPPNPRGATPPGPPPPLALRARR